MALISVKSCFRSTWLLTVLSICFLCSAFLTIKSNINRGSSSFSHQHSLKAIEMLSNSATTHEAVVKKVQIFNHQTIGFTSLSKQKSINQQQPSLQLEKSISQRHPPYNIFQFLYKDKTTLVYSAHYDNRDSAVKVVGFKHRFNISRYEQEVFCLFPDGELSEMTTLYNVSVMKPRPGLEYNTWIWQCDWKGKPPPSHLSLVTRSLDILVNRINITYHTFSDGAEKKRQPVICVKPMVKNYDDKYQLKEFIESSRMWGASKIVLYPHSVDEDLIRPLLNEYEAEGLVDVHEWKPRVPMESLHAFGQKSHNQHCLYTYMYRYEWAAFIDLDELVVAGANLTSMESMIQAGLLTIKDQNIQARVAGFTVRSQMCTTSLADDLLYKASGNTLCRITSMRKTNCTPAMLPGVWSKPLVNTEGTEIVDIHQIRLPRPSYTVIDLDPTIGTVCHYRALSRNSGVLAQSAKYNVLKRNTHKFMDKAAKQMKDICGYDNPHIGVTKYAD
ncbi:uncharacterized protein [Watersipora subatra]|uniref:uncharacterized protein isoform X1 n=1 Tax=Watersipora subatra TaxID=2589382 RepID=UPI00355B83C8